MKQVSIVVIDNQLTQEEFAPKYQTDGAAGIDLRASINPQDGALAIKPNETVLVPVGFAMHIADPNLCAMIIPRSGLGAKQGIVLGNGTGLIDSDYQGELKVALWNRSDKTFYVNPMERIAQMVFVPIVQIELTPVKQFVPTERAEGGFGSTGSK